MVLLFCDGVVYTAGELNFLVKIGWLPVDALLRCGLAWLTWLFPLHRSACN